METVTIPQSEYLELLRLFQELKQRLEMVIRFQVPDAPAKRINALKYCGTLKLTQSPMQIQKQMRDEWE